MQGSSNITLFQYLFIMHPLKAQRAKALLIVFLQVFCPDPSVPTVSYVTTVTAVTSVSYYILVPILRLQ